MAEGYVYVLNNAAHSGLLKIGGTARTVEDRVRELSTTGVPSRFAIVYSARVSDWEEAESEIFAALADRRYEPQREFFEMSVQEAITIVSGIASKHPVVEPPSPNVETPLATPSGNQGIRPGASSATQLPRSPVAIPAENQGIRWGCVNGVWYRR